jgi:hypothetical protein
MVYFLETTEMTNFKRQAKQLKSMLKTEHSADVPLNECQHRIAQIHGAKNWQTLIATQPVTDTTFVPNSAKREVLQALIDSSAESYMQQFLGEVAEAMAAANKASDGFPNVDFALNNGEASQAIEVELGTREAAARDVQKVAAAFMAHPDLLQVHTLILPSAPPQTGA